MRLVLKVTLTDEDTGCQGEVSLDIPAEAARLTRHSFQTQYAMPAIGAAWAQLRERVQNIEAVQQADGFRVTVQ